MAAGLFGHSKAELVQLKICQRDIMKTDVEIKNHIKDIKSKTFQSQKEIVNCTHDLKQEILRLNNLIDSLEKFISKVDTQNDRSELIAQVKEHRLEAERNRQLLREALQIAMKTMEERGRHFLFENENASEEMQLRNRTKQASNMVTDSVKATVSLTSLVSKMSDQLKLSEETASTLIHSSSILKETETEFSTMGAHIQSGGKLISKYGRRECTDKILITMALLLYVAVILYILRKRVLSIIY